MFEGHCGVGNDGCEHTMVEVSRFPTLQGNWTCAVMGVAYRCSKDMEDLDNTIPTDQSPHKGEVVFTQEPTADGWIAVRVKNKNNELRYLPIANHMFARDGQPLLGRDGQPLFVPTETEVELVRSNS